MRSPGTVHVLVPEGIEDPTRPSGGNIYDRRVCEGLAALGWWVRQREVRGSWPHPDHADRLALAATLAALPDDAVVLADGLIASTVPELLVPTAARLNLVVLLHMSLGERAVEEGAAERECEVLAAAAAVVTPSAWARRWLLGAYGLDPQRVHVAQPGVDVAGLAAGTADGRELLCVGAVTPLKGHDVLVAALGELRDLPWRCVCVGGSAGAPDFVAELVDAARATGIADRLQFTGPLTGSDLDASYGAADVVVVASRAESYGMVVTEALAHGLPVLGTEVGGLPEALGRAPDGTRPGLLVPPGDMAALVAVLRRWLVDPELRDVLRTAARQRRWELTGWSMTSAGVARVLTEVAG